MNAIKEKRALNLPELEVEPLDRLEGASRTSGANKVKAQIEYAQYIAPIIEENIDLDFGSYCRLALADAGTHSVVGKKYGLNGSIRFELDRPENKGLQKAMASIEKIKQAVDKETTQPVSYADLIAIVPHFAARSSSKRITWRKLATTTTTSSCSSGRTRFWARRCVLDAWTLPKPIRKA